MSVRASPLRRYGALDHIQNMAQGHSIFRHKDPIWHIV